MREHNVVGNNHRNTDIFSEFSTIVERVQLYYVIHLHIRHQSIDNDPGIIGIEVSMTYSQMGAEKLNDKAGQILAIWLIGHHCCNISSPIHPQSLKIGASYSAYQFT